MYLRPLDLREDELIVLIGDAIAANVFSQTFLSELRDVTSARFSGAGKIVTNVLPLDAFIDEMIRRASKAKPRYTPTIFIGLRRQYGTRNAISKLVQSGDIQSGFRRLKDLGMLDWTIEAAVLKFPDDFSRNDRECAAFRLEQARKEDMP